MLLPKRKGIELSNYKEVDYITYHIKINDVYETIEITKIRDREDFNRRYIRKKWLCN